MRNNPTSRKTAGAALALMLALTTASCSQPSTTPNATDSTSSAVTSSPDETTVGETTSIGYVVNFGAAEWYQNVIKGAEQSCAEMDCTLDWADSNMDLNGQINRATDMLTRGVDVLMLSPVDPGGLGSVMADAEAKDIPVIAETNPIEGVETTVGVNNFEAGETLGEYAGNYITDELKAPGKVLIIGLPTLKDTQDRTAGFTAGLEASGADFEIVQEVNGSGVRDASLEQATDALTANPDINIIFGINDDSTLGGVQAYTERAGNAEGLAAFIFGVEGDAAKAALSSDSGIKAGLGMFPEYVGRTLIRQALAAEAGEELPERTVTPAHVLTPENLGDFYTEDGDSWQLDYDAVDELN